MSLVEDDLQAIQRTARGRAEMLGEAVAISGEVHGRAEPQAPAGGPHCPS